MGKHYPLGCLLYRQKTVSDSILQITLRHQEMKHSGLPDKPKRYFKSRKQELTILSRNF
jgi:hypothetical protein